MTRPPNGVVCCISLVCQYIIKFLEYPSFKLINLLLYHNHNQYERYIRIYYFVPCILRNFYSIFTTSAKIAHRRDKTSRLYKRAIVFCFSVACPALTFYPARAVCFLSGKYGLVCAMGLRSG